MISNYSLSAGFRSAKLMLTIIIFLLLTGNAFAAKRYFSVGVNNYDNFPSYRQLKRAVNDSSSISNAFTNLEYTGVHLTNPSRSEFYDEWEKFIETVNENDTIVFYFSGHGVEIENQNYLLLKDVSYPKFAKRRRVRADGIKLGDIITDLSRANTKGVSVLIIDACRDDPFLPAEYTRGANTQKGLVPTDPPVGTFIMYSASAGGVSLDKLPNEDDSGKNSVYTRFLIDLVKDGKRPIVEIASRIKQSVYNATDSDNDDFKQRPTYYDGLNNGYNFCFGNCGGGGAQSNKEGESSNEELKKSTISSVNKTETTTNGVEVITSQDTDSCFDVEGICLSNSKAKRYAQNLLKDLNCYSGDIDGLFGPQTFDAVARLNTYNSVQLNLESSQDIQSFLTVTTTSSIDGCPSSIITLSSSEENIISGDPRTYQNRFVRGIDGRSKSGEFHTWAFSYREKVSALNRAAKIAVKYPGINPAVVKSISGGVTWWGVALATFTTEEEAKLIRDLARKLNISVDAYLRQQSS